jgi:hypothetical protein
MLHDVEALKSYRQSTHQPYALAVFTSQGTLLTLTSVRA